MHRKQDERQIRDAVLPIHVPIPLDLVIEYLRALETLKVVQRNG